MAFEKVVAGAIHAAVAGLTALPAMMLLMHRVTGVDVHPRWAAPQAQIHVLQRDGLVRHRQKPDLSV